MEEVICSTLIGPKPRQEEPCNTHDCPQWFEGSWSEVSLLDLTQFRLSESENEPSVSIAWLASAN